jgi:hypothetical protein
MSKIAEFEKELNANLKNVEVKLVSAKDDAMDIIHRATGEHLGAGETDTRLGAFFAFMTGGGQMVKFDDRQAALAYFDREADSLLEDLD